jgi:transposase
MSDQAGVAPTRRRYSATGAGGTAGAPIREKTGERHGAVQRVARQLGFGVETVRKWVKQADVDAGERPGHDDGGQREGIGRGAGATR